MVFLRKLISSNNEDSTYYDLLKQINDIDSLSVDEANKKMVQLFDDLSKQYPESSNIKRTKLLYLNGDDFKNGVDQFIRPFFIKGLPAVYSEVKGVLTTPEKKDIFEKLVLEHSRSLEEKSTFAGETKEQSPCCLLWSYMLLAQIYDRKKDYDLALQYVEKVHNIKCLCSEIN